METKSIVQVAVAVLVAVLVFVAVLVPVVGNATASTDTFTNSGYFRMAEIDEPVTIEWDHTDPQKITVNESVMDLSSVPRTHIVTLVATDSMIVRYAPITADTLVQSYSSTGYIGAGVTAGSDMSITIGDGSITTTSGSSTTTQSFESGYCISPTGNWIMTEGKAKVHTTDSIIVLAGNTKVGDPTVGIYAPGTIEDGLDFTTVQTSSIVVTPTYGDVEFDYTPVSGYNNLVTLSECDFQITVGSTTVDAVYSTFLVPYNVTAERTIHMTDAEASVIGIIPILVIVGLLISVIGIAIARRYDL